MRSIGSIWTSEEAKERRRLANLRREQKLKDMETKREIRKQRGGTGVTMVFYGLEPAKPPRSKKRVKK